MVTERVEIIITSKGTRVVTRDLKSIGTASKKSAGSVKFLNRAVAALGSAIVLRKLVRVADTYNLLQNRLRVVTDTSAELADVQGKLFDIANDSRSSIEQVVAIYSRFALSLRDTNIEQRQLLNLTENVTKAAIIGGAAQAEARAGLIQLSQALASNRLSGDELRSVLEQLPVVAQKIAREMGVGVGELRKLGEQGLITRDVLIGAFGEIDEELQEQFAKTVPTIAQSVTVLNNELVKSVGEFDKATGASAKFAKILIFTADNLDIIGKSLVAISLVMGPVLAVKVIPLLITALKGLGAAFATILGNPLFLLGALLAAAIAFREELGKLKGPIGQVGQALDEAFSPRHVQNIRDQEEAIRVRNAAAAAGLGVFNRLAVTIEKEASVIEKANERLQEQINILSGTDAAVKNLNKSKREATAVERERIDTANERLNAAKQEKNVLNAQIAFQKKFTQQEDKRVTGVRALNRALADGAISTQFYAQEFRKLAGAGEKVVSVQQKLADGTMKDILLTEDAAKAWAKLNETQVERKNNLKDIEELERKGLITLEKGAELRKKVLEGRETGRGKREKDSPLDTLLKDITDFSTQSEQVLVNAFQSAENALVDFVLTGKVNFSGLVDSVLADLTRLLARQALASLIGALGSASGGGGGAAGGLLAGLIGGARAGGGSVQSGRSYLVGERGPEIVNMAGNGSVTPNNEVGGASVTVINVTDQNEITDAMGSTEGEQVILNVLGRNKEAVKRAIS